MQLEKCLPLKRVARLNPVGRQAVMSGSYIRTLNAPELTVMTEESKKRIKSKPEAKSLVQFWRKMARMFRY